MLASPLLPADYICDTKLNQLGWKERTTWEDGLRKTVDWYLQNGEGVGALGGDAGDLGRAGARVGLWGFS